MSEKIYSIEAKNNLDFDAFSKKYEFALREMELRVSNKKGIREKLYSDALSNKVNMDDITSSIKLFYQGNVFGQVKMSSYLDRYNK